MRVLHCNALLQNCILTHVITGNQNFCFVYKSTIDCGQERTNLAKGIFFCPKWIYKKNNIKIFYFSYLEKLRLNWFILSHRIFQCTKCVYKIPRNHIFINFIQHKLKVQSLFLLFFPKLFLFHFLQTHMDIKFILMLWPNMTFIKR